MQALALQRPVLQALASRVTGEHAESLQAQARAQDKYNLDLYNLLANIAAPIVWTSLTPVNSWVYYGQSYNPPGYYQDATSRVWLKGVIKSGATGTTPLFSQALPPPVHQWDFVVSTDTGAGEVVIPLTGFIYLFAGGTGYVSLDGLSYVPSA